MSETAARMELPRTPDKIAACVLCDKECARSVLAWSKSSLKHVECQRCSECESDEDGFEFYKLMFLD